MGLVHLAVILGCATLIFGQSLSKTCSELQTLENFDSDKFTGLWYAITAEAGACLTARYRRLDNGTFEIKSRECDRGNELTVVGNLAPTGDVTKGQFIVIFPTVSSQTSPYWVLATDYKSYSVIGICRENYSPALIVYARSPKLEGEAKDAVIKILKNMTNEDFEFYSHENCCYDPNSATSIGFSVALLISTLIIRFF